MDKPEQILGTYWGYPSFRGMQREVIDSVLSKRDTLAILPTGGGKSICFQVPALLMPGLSIVVSPLLALIEDQVSALVSRGIRAASITSAISFDEASSRLDDAVTNDIKVLYVAPERLRSAYFRARIRAADISLLAVDEAHCISEWGHVFRPSYRMIADFRKDVCPDAVLTAVTATATPRVQDDIAEALQMRVPNRFRTTVDRPNIRWRVQKVVNKRELLLKTLGDVTGSKIVYAGTRRTVERTQEWLHRRNVEAFGYHGGMTTEDRSTSLEEWLARPDATMVATNAFGMGIDKDNVRLVVHIALPGTLEDYYQEAGRGGRDRNSAEALLLFNQGDLDRQKRLLGYGRTLASDTRKVVRFLAKSWKSRSPDFDWMSVHTADLFEHTGIDTATSSDIIGVLERKDLLELSTEDDGDMVIRIRKPGLMLKHPGVLRAYRARRMSQSRDVELYTRIATCRRKYLLNYFGEEASESCGTCSNCLGEEEEKGGRVDRGLLASSL